jgi:H+/Cl- antiporter ClcA
VDLPAQIFGPEFDEGSVDSPGRLPGGPVFSPEEHRAKATKLLALLLFAALIACFAAHFAAIWYFIHDKQALDEFNRVFNIWIPVLSGLFGSAATFYFTQGRK